MAGWNNDTAAGPLGAGTVTLVEGSSFSISQANGDILPELPHGVFHQDTRIVSRWTLTINNQAIEPLVAETTEPYRAVFSGRVPRPDGYADSPLLVERQREVGAGILEQVTIHNYSLEPVTCVIRLEVGADFADLFEVKEARIQRQWDETRQPHGDSLTIKSVWQDLSKTVIITAQGAHAGPDALTYDVLIPAKEQWSRRFHAVPVADGESPAAPFAHQGEASPHDVRQREWVEKIPVVQMGSRSIERTLRRSYEDLGALRIEDPEHPERVVVAAGAPWFMTLFGRDSLWASEMALPVDPSLALGTLQTLAERQGTVVDPISEEEPGKILHEVRLGVSSGLSLGGKSAYYGSVDATPLFVNVLGAVSRWGFAKETIAALLPHADRALEWIRDYGDKDGDGFVEYARLNDQGLLNQGWKDSWDGVTFADGRIPEAPIALCEVQAYVYSAYMSRAWMAYDAGDRGLATDLEERAARLKQRFNEQFWLPDKGYFALALDRDKHAVDACTSNMGQCLWYGIVDDDKVPTVVERLMSPEMFSGWGVRTLASDMGAYNPASYHNGSVWPHDNAVIVAGLMRYGFVHEAQRIATALLEAADYSDGRLPELFCGFDRRKYLQPVPYPTACSPQAWASTTPIFLMTSLLRYDVYVSLGGLWLDPVLPDSFGELHISNAPTGAGPVTIDAVVTNASVRGLPEGLVFHRGSRPWMTELMEQSHLDQEK
ncbi:amylo-alpha-1,6-glucosidase [Arthrobacter cupressi]|uniref:Glycogen debranching enzyme (Alpha-1,6-glucosidase) n=1 Tax=Arthrobacter cupressi TaxID=1045773 RepID=A0A1G8ST89_9MICC|nr:glycogen debranching N-terminal domain-containing protein [Arthrobacter cupressi]NYD78408.1 glycogen debranching enzyme [Arthrobacter cupressi]SDJ32401.1 Glycogen debranching enzyme (alpha-1,6-glucosidase) [Arthrobacter cupressi]